MSDPPPGPGSTLPPVQELAPLVRAGPLVFLIHGLEELAGVESWTRTHGEGFPEPLRSLLPVGTVEFAVAILVLFLVFVVVARAAARSPARGRALDVFLLLVAAMGVNALVHALQAAAPGTRAPGLLTAVLVAVPYSVVVFRRVDALGLRRRRWMAGVVLLGAVVQGPAAGLALSIGRIVAG